MHFSELLSKVKGHNIPLYSIKDSVISVKNLADSSLSDLNDSELGFLYGYVGAMDGKSLEALIKSLSTQNQRFKYAVPQGFLSYGMFSLPSASESISLQDSVKEYRANPSVQSFVKVLDSLDAVHDAQLNSDIDYVLNTDEKGDYTIDIKVSKNNLAQAKDLLDNDDTLEIKGEDNDSVFIGSKVSDSQESSVIEDSDADEYDLHKVNQNKYEVLKNGLMTYTLEKKGNNWTCTCPAYQYRHRCRHLGLLQDVLPSVVLFRSLRLLFLILRRCLNLSLVLWVRNGIL